jgi:hypothetical protein
LYRGDDELLFGIILALFSGIVLDIVGSLLVGMATSGALAIPLLMLGLVWLASARERPTERLTPPTRIRPPLSGLSFALGASTLHVVHPFDEFVEHWQVSDIPRRCNVYQFPPTVCDHRARTRYSGDSITGDDPLSMVSLRIATASRQLFRIGWRRWVCVRQRHQHEILSLPDGGVINTLTVEIGHGEVGKEVARPQHVCPAVSRAGRTLQRRVELSDCWCP